MTAEQLEAARAERMRQNGHGAITIEDVRTWIEETGLCIFLPRSAQAGQSVLTAPTATPTFVEAVAGQRTTEPTLELIHAAESLLVRLEGEGVAVRLNLAGQPGDQPDYVVAGWVLPYIYALRGDRDWRRSPQLTGSRQVSQLAVQAAKQLDSANMTATQIRDALGREVTEAAVLRALHELWKQLRIIPVVPAVGVPALWQPLRQRFQKAIAEGASTSQVTAISVLASIYLQAVIAASMEDVEMFLSPLTSRSKIREVVRGLAATRQVHSTTMGHSPMFYVAGTLPEFPAVPSFQISNSLPSYRGSAYLAAYLGHDHDHDEHPVPSQQVSRYDESHDALPEPVVNAFAPAESVSPAGPVHQNGSHRPEKPVAEPVIESELRHLNSIPQSAKPHVAGKVPSSGKAAPPRPRSAQRPGAAHPRERSRTGLGSSDSRSSSAGDRRRAPAPRSASGGNGTRNASGPSRPARSSSFSNGNGNHTKPTHAAGNGHAHNGNGSHSADGNGKNGAHVSAQGSKSAYWGARSVKNGAGNGTKSGARPAGKTEVRPGNRNSGAAAKPRSVAGHTSAVKPGARNGAASGVRGVAPRKTGGAARPAAHPAASKRTTAEGTSRSKPVASASKRYSFSGQAKQAPKPSKTASGRSARPASKPGATVATKSHSKSAHSAPSKRRG